jgi:putative FmdB family regulatory protein
MAIYEYRCERHGAFDVMRPIGTAPASVACPECAEEAVRVFSNPMVSFAPRELVAALDHEQRTRYEPDLVTSLPAKGARRATPMATLTPQLAKLPRPQY